MGVHSLRRCSRCVLPASFPGITFDEEGVCNYCRTHTMPEVKDKASLEKILAQYRGKGKYDCVLMYSGGRDSSYAAYELVETYGMSPLLVTYDWGLMTPYAYQNWEMTANKLDLDHYIIRPNLRRTLSGIRKNVMAFLKKPRVHMFPLFTGPDKSMDVEIARLTKKLGIPLAITSGGGGYEKTLFKMGFFGIYGGGLMNTIKLGTKIAFEFIRNPRYINSSVIIGFRNFFYYLFARQHKIDIEWVKFYHYIQWNEDEIVSTIKKKLDWISPPDTELTWRTDDGTAPFYNYLHYKLAGFTENDTLRSIQIREGDITRDQGLRMVLNDNEPRYEGPFSIKAYCERIGIPYEYAVKVIESAPKYYE